MPWDTRTCCKCLRTGMKTKVPPRLELCSLDSEPGHRLQSPGCYPLHCGTASVFVSTPVSLLSPVSLLDSIAVIQCVSDTKARQRLILRPVFKQPEEPELQCSVYSVVVLGEIVRVIGVVIVAGDGPMPATAIVGPMREPDRVVMNVCRSKRGRREMGY